MFRHIAQLGLLTADQLVTLHSSQLTGLLELIWEASRSSPPAAETRLTNVIVPAGGAGVNALAGYLRTLRIGQPLWDHLIYAYMIENTCIYEIFGRVVQEFRHGEKLGHPSTAGSQEWLRNTEELFYRDPPHFFISAVTSYVRPDLRATRRNAYYRMFGMDLNHGGEDKQPYRYTRADAANTDFVATFEELLREVWVGMIHLQATAIPRYTDDAKILTLSQQLQQMLAFRRQGGNITREEFLCVAMMSWFQLVIETEPPLPILQDLRATGNGSEQRLFQIAQRVGIPAHGLSRSYFDIADPISRILRLIEVGVAAADAFYVPGSLYPAPLTPGPFTIEGDMRAIINNWSTITGRDVKARKVATA